MHESQLRVGVIGLGNRSALAVNLKDVGGQVVAGADPRPASYNQFRERFGPDVFVTDDYRRLLDRTDIDAVFITSPDWLHDEHTVAALRAGKAVYLEKPMAITLEGCDRILQAAYETRSRLYLGHNMRHFPVMRKMKELIDSGAIGQVKTAWCRHFVSYGGDAYFKDWHAERSKATSLLLQKGAHDIDILHWLCGGYSRRVTAIGKLSVYGQITDRRAADEYGDATFRVENWPPLSQKALNPIIDVEDLNLMLMELDNGVLASYQQCHYTPDGWRNYTIIGTEGRVENFGDVPGPKTEVRLWNQRGHYCPEGNARFLIPEESEGGHGGADPNIVAEFVRFAREGGATETSPVAAREAVAAGCMATMSLRQMSVPLNVEPLPQKWVEYFDGGQR